MLDSKKVIRIGADGKREIIFNTNSVWTVCSGTFDNNGDMWVLENSPTNEVRARKIHKQELAKGNIGITPATKPHILITIFTGMAIIVLFFSTRFILARRKQNLDLAI